MSACECGQECALPPLRKKANSAEFCDSAMGLFVSIADLCTRRGAWKTEDPHNDVWKEKSSLQIEWAKTSDLSQSKQTNVIFLTADKR